MNIQYEKMLSGELCEASAPLLFQKRVKTRNAIQAYNQTSYDWKKRALLLIPLIGKTGANADIQTSFFATTDVISK